MAVNDVKTCVHFFFIFEIRTKKAFPQSVRFNYALTDNSKDRLTITMVDDNLYLKVIQTVEIHGKHHGSGHR